MPTPAAPRVRTDTSRADVQRIMNDTQTEGYWNEGSSRWQNLLTARNEFARSLLHEYGISTSQYKALLKVDKRYNSQKIEAAFSASDGFFKYTRGSYWMQDAVGDSGSWLSIRGMARWHIRQALASLEARSNGSATPPYSSNDLPPALGTSSRVLPFDPVRDSVDENSTNQQGAS